MKSSSLSLVTSRRPHKPIRTTAASSSTWTDAVGDRRVDATVNQARRLLEIIADLG